MEICQRIVPVVDVFELSIEAIPLSSKLDILDIDSMRGHEQVKAHRHFEASWWG